MTTAMNPQGIKALVFDMGGVLALDAPRYFLSELAVRHTLDVEELVRIWRACLGPLARGAISEDDFWRSFIAELNLREEPEELLAQFKKEIRMFLLLDKDLLAYIRKLKEDLNAHRKEPVKFAICSNQVKEWARTLEAQEDLSEIFEIIIYSCNEGMTKPAPDLFKKLIDRLDVKPGNVLFIDNREKNLRAAKDLGMHALLFTTTEECKATLAPLLAHPSVTAQTKG